jgi:hypothetical protein
MVEMLLPSSAEIKEFCRMVDMSCLINTGLLQKKYTLLKIYCKCIKAPADIMLLPLNKETQKVIFLLS